MLKYFFVFVLTRENNVSELIFKIRTGDWGIGVCACGYLPLNALQLKVSCYVIKLCFDFDEFKAVIKFAYFRKLFFKGWMLCAKLVQIKPNICECLYLPLEPHKGGAFVSAILQQL